MSASSIPLTRVCSKCNIEKLLTDEYFHKTPTCRYGYRRICKICIAAYKKVYRDENADYIRENKRQYREDNKDAIAKKKHDYHAANREKIAAKRKLYYAKVRDRLLQYQREYRERNLDYIRQRDRLYALAHRKEAVLKSRQYYWTNHAAISAKQKALYRSNPDAFLVRINRRKARLLELPHTLTIKEWQHAKDHFNGCCAVCGRPFKDLFGTHTVAQDHWIPLSSPDCPGTIAKNIIPLCHGVSGCNNSKRDKNAFQWLVERFGKRKAKHIYDKIIAYFDSIR